MHIGPKLKTISLRQWKLQICSYIVGKYLPSSKWWLIIGMDIPVYDQEISLLISTKIPEKSEKSEFFVGGPKISIFEDWLVFYIKVLKMSDLVKFY